MKDISNEASDRGTRIAAKRQESPPPCERPPWHPNCYWPNCKCGKSESAAKRQECACKTVCGDVREKDDDTRAVCKGLPVRMGVPNRG